MSDTIYNLNAMGRADVEHNETGLLVDASSVQFTDASPGLLFIGIDCGSTQTRCCVVPNDVVEDPDLDLSEWFDIGAVIPSISKQVPSAQKFSYKSSLLIDRLDSEMSVNGINRTRLVRGTKAMEFEVRQNELVASEKKVDSVALRYNIADAIGYSLIAQGARTGEPVPTYAEVCLIIALPPDDLKMRSAVEKVKQELTSIRWSWCGHQTLHFVVKDFKICSEPEAQVKGYYATNGQEIPEEILMLEVGGRNGATALLVNFQIIDQGSKSLEQSGAQLLDKIGDAYITEYGGRMPSTRHLLQALQTGKMKFGNGYRNIVPIIRKAKDEVAEDLFYKMQSQVISRQTVVSLQTLNTIILGGRVFGRGDYDYSVADRFTELVRKASPGTVVVTLSENYIPKGLILKYLTDLEENS